MPAALSVHAGISAWTLPACPGRLTRAVYAPCSVPCRTSGARSLIQTSLSAWMGMAWPPCQSLQTFPAEAWQQGAPLMVGHAGRGSATVLGAVHAVPGRLSPYSCLPMS